MDTIPSKNGEYIINRCALVMKSMGNFSALKDIMDFTEKLGGLIAHIVTFWIGIPFCKNLPIS